MKIRESIKNQILDTLISDKVWEEYFDRLLDNADFSLVESLYLSDVPSTFSWTLDQPYCDFSIIDYVLFWKLNITLPNCTLSCSDRQIYYNGEYSNSVSYQGGDIYFRYHSMNDIGMSLQLNVAGLGSSAQPRLSYQQFKFPLPIVFGSLYSAQLASYLYGAQFLTGIQRYFSFEIATFTVVGPWHVYVPYMEYIFGGETIGNITKCRLTGTRNWDLEVASYYNHVITFVSPSSATAATSLLLSNIQKIEVECRVPEYIDPITFNNISLTMNGSNDLLVSYIKECIPYWVKYNLTINDTSISD